MKNKKNIIIAAVLTVVSVVYTLLVKFVDVKEIGPNNSSVGFSSLNKWFSNLIGSNLTIYKISEVLGYVIMLLVLIYGCIGIGQLIKRKSLLKVDKEIIKLVALCICFSSLITSKRYFNKNYIKMINLVTIILTSLVVLLRLISGVHWFTDIIGGILISLFLVYIFYISISVTKKR